MNRILAASAAIFLMGSVSACGLTGGLQRPDPLIGNPDGSEPAKLPDPENNNLPQLPDRQSETPDAADDELLGGPGGS